MPEVTLEMIRYGLFLNQFIQRNEQPEIIHHNPRSRSFEVVYPGDEFGSYAGTILYGYKLNEEGKVWDVFIIPEEDGSEDPDLEQDRADYEKDGDLEW